MGVQLHGSAESSAALRLKQAELKPLASLRTSAENLSDVVPDYKEVSW